MQPRGRSLHASYFVKNVCFKCLGMNAEKESLEERYRNRQYGVSYRETERRSGAGEGGDSDSVSRMV